MKISNISSVTKRIIMQFLSQGNTTQYKNSCSKYYGRKIRSLKWQLGISSKVEILS
jgi:hypothetical protein